jgi:Icc-related predicted phosphoesterase
MYLLRLFNDLHNEFTVFDIPVLPSDADTVLCLAGDIYTRKHIMEWLRPLSARFKAVVCVLGNHDYWSGDVDRLPFTIRHWLRDNPLPNVHILFDESVIIDGVHFFGGTCWTDFNKMNPLTVLAAADIKDYKYIRYGGNYQKRWTPQEAYRRHLDFNHALAESMEWSPVVRSVVLSHHAPHQMSSNPKYQDVHENGSYFSDLSELILDHPEIVLWHHGHVHYRNQYYIGDTLVACNPRGYMPRFPVNDFDPELIIDLDAMPAR